MGDEEGQWGIEDGIHPLTLPHTHHERSSHSNERPACLHAKESRTRLPDRRAGTAGRTPASQPTPAPTARDYCQEICL